SIDTQQEVAPRPSPSRRDRRPFVLALVLVPLLCALFVVALRVGVTGMIPDLATTLRGAFAALHLASPLDASQQIVVELRLWRALTAAGVGAALGLAGAYVQGVFRNGLASPSVLGISGGASLGAIAAILIVGGYGPRITVDPTHLESGLVLVPLFA